MSYATEVLKPRRQITTFAKLQLSILTGTDESDGSKGTTTQTVYLCSRGIGWFNTPNLDETGGATQVFWNGMIAEPIEIRRSVPDGFTGFVPVEVSPLVINLDGEVFEPYLARISWKASTVEIWECVGNLETDNVSKVFTGRLGDATWTDTQLTVSMTDNAVLLEVQATTPAIDKEAGHDPKFHGRAMPYIFGDTGWVRGVVLDYKGDSPTTSDNRKWAFCAEASSGKVAIQVASIVSGNKFQPTTASHRRLVGANNSPANGNQIDRVQRTTGGATNSNVQDSDSTGITLGGSSSVGNVWTRNTIQTLVFYKLDGSTTKATQEIGGTHVSEANYDSMVCAELASTFDASILGLGGALNPDDWLVLARLRGPADAVTIDGTFLDPDEDHNGNFTAAQAIVWMLENAGGFATTDFDLASFQALMAARGSEAVNMVEPYDSTEPLISLRDCVGRLLAKATAIAFFNANGKLVVKPRAAFGTADYSVTDSDIVGEPEFFVVNTDVAKVQNPIQGAMLVSGPNNSRSSPLTTDPISENLDDGDRAKALQTGTVYTWNEALGFAEISTFEVGATVDEEFEGIRRAGDFYSFPRLGVKLTLGGEFLDLEPGDVIEIQRERLPGFSYVAGTIRSKKFFVTSVTRADGFVTIEGDDQAGVEWYKNESRWSPKANT